MSNPGCCLLKILSGGKTMPKDKIKNNNKEGGVTKKSNQIEKITELTDLDIAENVVFQKELLLEPITKQFWGYEKSKGLHTTLTKPEIKANILEQLKSFDHNVCIRRVNSIYGLTTLINHLPKDRQFDDKKELLNLENGVLNIETFDLLPFNKDYLQTIKWPVRYEINATCPGWREFIVQITKGNKKLARVLQEMSGYCLIASTKYQKVFFLIGPGQDGKSVFLIILQFIIAKDLISNLNFKDLDKKTYLAELEGKFVNIAPEVESNRITSTSIFKAVSGSDIVSADKKYKDPKSIQVFAKWVSAGNNMPRVTDTTFGYERRLMIIPFQQQFLGDKQDKDLVSKLKKERDGIFMWALEGLKRLQLQGDFTQCDLIDQALKEYLKEINPLKIFIEDKCFVSEGFKEDKELFIFTYREWCRENGFAPLNTISLSKELKKLGFTSSHSGNQKYYKGLELIGTEGL